MACKECKKKKNEEPINIDKIESYTKLFLVIWSIFAVYGIYSFVKLFV